MYSQQCKYHLQRHRAGKGVVCSETGQIGWPEQSGYHQGTAAVVSSFNEHELTGSQEWNRHCVKPQGTQNQWCSLPARKLKLSTKYLQRKQMLSKFQSSSQITDDFLFISGLRKSTEGFLYKSAKTCIPSHQKSFVLQERKMLYIFLLFPLKYVV